MHDRVSVNSLCFMGTGLADQVALWREIAPRRISFMTWQVFEAGEDAARAIVEEGGYRVATLSHGFHMGALPHDEEGWRQPRAALSRAIRFAASVGAESIYMVTGGRGERSWEEATEHFSAAVAPCLAEAREAGVPILIETAPPLYCATHLAHTLRDTIALAELAGIGVCIDIFSVWTEPGLRDIIERALPLTRLVQVSDYVYGDNSLPCRAVPGDGDIPLRQIIEWIVRGGYANSFDLELLGPRIDGEGQARAAGRAARWVSEVLDSLGA